MKPRSTMPPFSPAAEIRAVPPAERARVLEMLLPGISPAPLEAALGSLAGPDGSELFAAYRGERVVGGIYLQRHVGGLCFLTGPQLAAGEAEETRLALLRRATECLDAQGVSLTQGLSDSDSGPEAVALAACGFEAAVVLLYLVSLRGPFPQEEPRGDFTLEPYQSADWERLAQILQQTYIATLDCPTLHDDRNPEENLRGYEATGDSGTRWWRILRHQERDSGCLLLGDFPKFEQLELIYFGIVPDARGSGLGSNLVRWAQWLAGSLGRERLVLAVDEQNAPAIAIYAAHGFQAWQRRHIWLRPVRSGSALESRRERSE